MPFAIVFVVAAAVAYLTTPLVRRVAVSVGAVAIPDDRKVHQEPMPYGGGVAMFLGFVAAMVVAWTMPRFRDLFGGSTEPLGVLIAGSILVAVGVVDDMRDITARTRLAGQLLAAGVLVLSGVQIFYVWLPGLGVISLSSDLSAVVTVIWTIAVINAMNLIDGLDGLAAGVTSIAAISFFIYAYGTATTANGEVLMSELLTAIVAGCALGFLKHNFNPARIFMGDAGAYLLGLLLATATVSGISRTTEPRFVDVAGFVIPVMLPLLVLAIPLADVGFAIMRRVRGRRPVFHADKEHIHHWLLEMARSHRQAVLVMYLWSALIALASLTLALGPGLVWRFVSGAIALVLIGSVLIIPRVLRRGRALSLVPTDDIDTGTA